MRGGLRVEAVTAEQDARVGLPDMRRAQFMLADVLVDAACRDEQRSRTGARTVPAVGAAERDVASAGGHGSIQYVPGGMTPPLITSVVTTASRHPPSGRSGLIFTGTSAGSGHCRPDVNLS